MMCQRLYWIRMSIIIKLAVTLLLIINQLDYTTATSADLDNQYELGLDKRAYTYSTSKRPQYNFGVGKRNPGNRRAQKMFTFGLGKRLPSEDEINYWGIADEDYFGDNDQSEYSDLDKRARSPEMFNFGVGKRPNSDRMFAFGLGKRVSEYNGLYPRSQRYNFGIGKRNTNEDFGKLLDLLGEDKNHNIYTRANQRYNFGFGKRSNNGLSQRSLKFNFGVGKRDGNNQLYDDLENLMDDKSHNIETRAIRKFNFGVGKRDSNGDLGDLLENENSHYIGTRASSKFNFGVGKRYSEDYDDSHNIDTRAISKFNFGVGKQEAKDDMRDFSSTIDDDKSHNVGTRSISKFNFGVGKRNDKDNLSDFLETIDNDKFHDIYARASAKYNFGVGKRFPNYDTIDEISDLYEYRQPNLDLIKKKYEFGIGKRSPEDFSEVMQMTDGLNRDNRAGLKYAFGVGKREVSKEDLQQIADTSKTTTVHSAGDLQNQQFKSVKNRQQLASEGENLTAKNVKV